MATKKKKIATTLIVICFSLVISTVIVIKSMPKPMFHGDYPYYSDVDSIVQASDVIIVGDVISAREVKDLMVDRSLNKTDKETIPYTLSTVKIVTVIKGNVKVGDVITIKQLGDYKNKPEETLYEMDGYLTKDTEHLMFLCEYNNSPYSSVNPAQGIIEVRNGTLYSANRYSLFGYNDGSKRKTDSLDTVIESVKEVMD